MGLDEPRRLGRGSCLGHVLLGRVGRTKRQRRAAETGYTLGCALSAHLWFKKVPPHISGGFSFVFSVFEICFRLRRASLVARFCPWDRPSRIRCGRGKPFRKRWQGRGKPCPHEWLPVRCNCASLRRNRAVCVGSCGLRVRAENKKTAVAHQQPRSPSPFLCTLII